jgi:hypothetical protein
MIRKKGESFPLTTTSLSVVWLLIDNENITLGSEWWGEGKNLCRLLPIFLQMFIYLSWKKKSVWIYTIAYTDWSCLGIPMLTYVNVREIQPSIDRNTWNIKGKGVDTFCLKPLRLFLVAVSMLLWCVVYKKGQLFLHDLKTWPNDKWIVSWS